MEADLIKFFGTHWPTGLNAVTGTPKGKKFSNEIKLKLSEGQKRRWARIGAQRRVEIGEVISRTFQEPNSRNRLSEAIKRAWADPEKRPRMGNKKKGIMGQEVGTQRQGGDDR